MRNKRLDGTGRLVIPKDVRDELGWKKGTLLSFSFHEKGVLVFSAEEKCLVCGETENLVPLFEKGFLCRSCIEKIKLSFR